MLPAPRHHMSIWTMLELEQRGMLDLLESGPSPFANGTYNPNIRKTMCDEDIPEWPNNNEWRVGTVNDYEGPARQEMVINREKADQAQQEENQPETTTHPAEGEQREYLKKWNYKPILPSLPTTPRKVLGLITYTPIVKNEDKTLFLSDDIFVIGKSYTYTNRRI